MSTPHRIETAPVLAAAIAHEVGHMLLPRGSHGSAGLMRAAWEHQDFRLAAGGRLQFTTEEAVAIRKRLVSRD